MKKISFLIALAAIMAMSATFVAANTCDVVNSITHGESWSVGSIMDSYEHEGSECDVHFASDYACDNSEHHIEISCTGMGYGEQQVGCTSVIYECPF